MKSSIFGLSIFEEVVLVFLMVPAILPVADVLGAVMVEVASLTKSGQVAEPVIVSVPIKVGYGQDYFGSRVRMGLIVMGTAPFALVSCPAEPDHLADQGPLGMVFGVVDGH
jgi:hypothetical protein